MLSAIPSTNIPFQKVNVIWIGSPIDLTFTLSTLLSGGECGVVYNQRFTLPKAPGPQKVAGGYLKRAGAPGPFVGTDMAPLWYSYDHGPIHFLVYSTELDFYPGSPQYKCAPIDTSEFSARDFLLEFQVNSQGVYCNSFTAVAFGMRRSKNRESSK